MNLQAPKARQRDVYGSLAALRRIEREGIDYRIRSRTVSGSSTTVLAPHGGRIELGTSSIARAIAGNEFNFYAFEGLKRSGNKTLHITSHRYEEQKCLLLLERSRVVMSIHGCTGRDREIYLGGLDFDLKEKIGGYLRAIGYRAKTRFHLFPGTHPNNICNRGFTGAGVQLELSRGFRNHCKLRAFVAGVRSILLEHASA